jgi:hypothetical protein
MALKPKWMARCWIGIITFLSIFVVSIDIQENWHVQIVRNKFSGAVLILKKQI